jgi:hypothetical protein
VSSLGGAVRQHADEFLDAQRALVHPRGRDPDGAVFIADREVATGSGGHPVLVITPFSPPSGPAQRLFQEPPAKSKFLAVSQSVSFSEFFASPGSETDVPVERFGYLR